MILDFIFLGIIAGAFSVLWCSDFNPMTSVWRLWVETDNLCTEHPVAAEREGYNKQLWSILGWLAYPFGYCLYCNTFWVSVIIYLLYLSQVNIAAAFILIGLATVLGVSYITSLGLSRAILHNHPDFEEEDE